MRFCVLGTGRIATKVGKVIARTECSEIRAVASRSQQRADEWAMTLDVPHAFGSYAEGIENPEIDAVYIALPPPLHHEWTIRAAELGKHVLCEKPAGMNADEVREMTSACEQEGVQFMDGVMWLHTERSRAMKEIIDSGELGELKRITSSYSNPALSQWDHSTEIRMNPEQGGGSLYDLGWYNVGATLWVTGQMPSKVWASAEWQQGVDISCSAMMWFDSGTVASFDVSFDTVMRKWIEVAGRNSSIVCDDFTRVWDNAPPRFWVHDGWGKNRTHEFEPEDQIEAMIEAYCRYARTTVDPHWPQFSVQTQVVLDALLKSAKTGREVIL
ncbi:Gfo/Idh/MocA family protein [Calycomorphotria hydatis]|nr:Gfo/Idh/MocA family oxidoreductase [Calycomorphotria hydatis]